MRRIIASFFLLFLLFNVNAQEIEISDSTRVSLLTCSPGEEVYAKFGHSGIRVVDFKNDIDIVFNYGLFNFESSDFYLKFIKGETDYQLGITSTIGFLAEYRLRKSFVWEQKLNLSPEENRNLINSLLINYEPKNRIYRYNFIYDNCSTRPRDKILKATNGVEKLKSQNELRTFRNWVGLYTGYETWVKFGIDLVFGKPADNNASRTQSMFLPEILMSEFDNIYIVVKDSGFTETKLVSEKKALVEGEYREVEAPDSMTKPIYIFSIILIIGALLTFIETKTLHYYRLFDSILLFITGLAGIVIFFLMFFSVHPLVKSNLNILWLNPLNIIAAVIIWIKPWKFAFFIYNMLNMILLFVVLILLAISYQSFNVAIYPIIILLIIRYSSYIINSNRVKKKIRKSNEGSKPTRIR
ncbi:MAG TPA: DUF4105 domain-containing protein [Paludibacter sp.]|nr:DUF4105 domain-containing protein [Paludibacter sp.]